jgi:3-hydroxyisobutyrate dehydrogenase-like beta-hydroxyacid dehydrogenase
MAGIIGFCGLGDMGAVIVPRLLDAGYDVVGWNRTAAKAKPLLDSGMRWADTPRQVAEEAEMVFSVLTDGAAVIAVALGPDGIISGLQKDAVFVDMSTISPEVSRGVSAEFTGAGLTMLDGPLSGSPITVAAGTASIMLGGDEAACERVRTGAPGVRGDRAKGDAHRRSRAGLPDEDRRQSFADG